jgi:hypothetical protein
MVGDLRTMVCNSRRQSQEDHLISADLWPTIEDQVAQLVGDWSLAVGDHDRRPVAVLSGRRLLKTT